MSVTSVASGPIGFILHRAHADKPEKLRAILGDTHELNALSAAVARRFGGIRINPEAMRQILSVPGDLEQNIDRYGPVALILTLAPHDRCELEMFLRDESLNEVSEIVANHCRGVEICSKAVKLIVIEFRHLSLQNLQDAGSVGTVGALPDGKPGKARKSRKSKPRAGKGRRRSPVCRRRSVRNSFCH